MKKASRAQLQAQIDTLRRQQETLQSQIVLQAWLHAELVQEAGYAVGALAWLHAERGHFLQQFIESEQRLITRARAVKAAKTQAANAELGVTVP